MNDRVKRYEALGFRVRRIQKKDNKAFAQLIRSVMPEFDAVGEGYSINDSEVDAMFEAYSDERSDFLVVEDSQGVLQGGAGIGPLKGASSDICELRKMYFYKEARGVGLGSELLQRLLEKAKELGYKECYLETLKRMDGARRLYESFGFEPLERPMASTGHFTCDAWYTKSLE